MSASEPRPWHVVRKIGRVTTWIGVGFLAYVLSMGPALQMNKRGWISGDTVGMIYAPVSLLADVPGIRWVMERYLELWASPNR